MSDDLRSDYLPDARPVGCSGWRKNSYALQAAGCLAGGMWLGVGTVESFWSASMWPEALTVVQLLTVIASVRLQTTPADLSQRLASTSIF